MAQTQNKNQKNPTHEKPVPATVLPNNLDTQTKTSNCTPKGELEDIPFKTPLFIYSVTMPFFVLQPH
jgi:hypothetical protein